MNDRLERSRAVRAAEGSLRLEGMEPSEADRALARRYALGEITLDEFLASGGLEPSRYVERPAPTNSTS